MSMSAREVSDTDMVLKNNFTLVPMTGLEPNGAAGLRRSSLFRDHFSFHSSERASVSCEKPSRCRWRIFQKSEKTTSFYCHSNAELPQKKCADSFVESACLQTFNNEEGGKRTLYEELETSYDEEEKSILSASR